MKAMKIRALLCSAFLIAGTLLAQQPIPVGKMNESSRNYRGADGSVLSKSSSDSDLENAINQSLSDNPEFRGVRASVKHHRVTLSGEVEMKSAKREAESQVSRFVAVRSVKNKIRIAQLNTDNRATMTSSAH